MWNDLQQPIDHSFSCLIQHNCDEWNFLAILFGTVCHSSFFQPQHISSQFFHFRYIISTNAMRLGAIYANVTSTCSKYRGARMPCQPCPLSRGPSTLQHTGNSLAPLMGLPVQLSTKGLRSTCTTLTFTWFTWNSEAQKWSQQIEVVCDAKWDICELHATNHNNLWATVVSVCVPRRGEEA